MFKGFAQARSLLLNVVFLRRISRALERANQLAETDLMLRYPAWYKASKVQTPQVANTRPTRRLSDLSAPTIEELNAAYKEKHPDVEEASQDEYDIT